MRTIVPALASYPLLVYNKLGSRIGTCSHFHDMKTDGIAIIGSFRGSEKLEQSETAQAHRGCSMQVTVEKLLVERCEAGLEVYFVFFFSTVVQLLGSTFFALSLISGPCWLSGSRFVAHCSLFLCAAYVGLVARVAFKNLLGCCIAGG